MSEIKKGDKVKIEYTGKLTDGSVFDSSEGRAPLCFEVGAKQVIPGFDNAVEGMKMDEEKEFTLKVDEAYGPIKAELVQEVPRDKLPEKPEPEVGMMLMMQAPTGQQIPAKITKIADDKVTIDINHPLAGKDLTFTVKVVGVNEPEEVTESKDSESSDKPAEPKAEEAKESVADGEKKKDDDEDCGPSDCSSCAGCQ
jgi:peptidylprolyl isomerase